MFPSCDVTPQVRSFGGVCSKTAEAGRAHLSRRFEVIWTFDALGFVLLHYELCEIKLRYFKNKQAILAEDTLNPRSEVFLFFK